MFYVSIKQGKLIELKSSEKTIVFLDDFEFLCQNKRLIKCFFMHLLCKYVCKNKQFIYFVIQKVVFLSL